MADKQIDPTPNEQYSQHFIQIVDYVLSEDKWRNKLLKLALDRTVLDFEKAFPNQEQEHFDYVGSGSYAQVYRQIHDQQKLPSNACIIKLIDIFSDNLLENLNGVSGRKSVSTYRDAFNEFKISITLSYLNKGLSIDNSFFRCPIFPEVFQCFVVRNSIPEYFTNSSKIKRIDYEKLLAEMDGGRGDGALGDKSNNNNPNDKKNIKNNNNNNKNNNNRRDDENNKMCRSRPSVKDIQLIKPEVAAIKMEDCGIQIGDVVNKLKPLEILSLVKQLLLGFMVAEDVFEFEHRDLHLGNILVKQTDEETLTYLYEDKVIKLSSYRVLVKLIDTTFSRIKFKNRVYYRNLSHLFDEKEVSDAIANKHNNRLSHQDQTYVGMAAEINNDWAGYYPRTNVVWSIYIIKKILRCKPLRRPNCATSTANAAPNEQQQQTNKEAVQVRQLLQHYIRLLFRTENMFRFFLKMYRKPELNRLVPIEVLTLSL